MADGVAEKEEERRVNHSGCFRHELKYRIRYPQYIELKSRLRKIARPDGHVNADGKYLIRSIYFDNYDDKALREKTYGISRREKFRIRYYNDDFSFIALEKKSKEGDLCRKIDAVLSKEECLLLLHGQTGWMRGHPSPLVRELYAKMRYQMLCPRVLVSYMREPYIYPAGNVRITFDSNIRTTMYHRDFFEDRVRDIDIAEEPGDMIMEVKYDAFLPALIRDIVRTDAIRREAFSKYAACRRFG